MSNFQLGPVLDYLASVGTALVVVAKAGKDILALFDSKAEG